ncbi:hypothetical protein RJ639_039100 [Escallonia herrerae]|uniref:Uncharacterized protein n=1 Tax=Escallonia herrerae TaxID=1293975 RepID=A0AA88WZ55_9ASTE|nr:hypothetical protein RJ639_039100 [Escallonia herrerae]
MAGTLQTLNVKPPAYAILPSRRPNSRHHFPGARILDDASHHNLSLIWKPRSIPTRPITRAAERPYQADGGRPQPPSFSDSARPLLSFVETNFLPLACVLLSAALVGEVALGLANPSLGCFADKYHISKFSTFGIFIISGLTLRSQEIGAAAEAWLVGLFGLGSILLFTPVFSRLILQLQLQPQEFVTGLAIFSCMPTTLSSGVALTRLAGGNSALALAMTLISSLLGILIVPFTISKFIAAGVGVSFPAKQLFKSLVLTLLPEKGLELNFEGSKKMGCMLSVVLDCWDGYAYAPMLPWMIPTVCLCMDETMLFTFGLAVH